VVLHDVRDFGTGSDDRHVAPQHVAELRELVDLRPAQPRAESEDARVVVRRDGAPVPALVDVHGAQLEHREQAAAQPYPMRAIQDRAGAREADAHRRDREERCDDEQEDAGEQPVNRAFDHCAMSAARS